MKIFCESLQSNLVFITQGKYITIDVDENTKIIDIKNKILEKENIPIEKQILLLRKKKLENDKKLVECLAYNNPELLAISTPDPNKAFLILKINQ